MQFSPKITVEWYLLVKDKNRKERYYWCCEYRKSKNCSGRAVTILENKQHILIKSTGYNHAPEASRIDVVSTLNMINEIAASQTRVKPSQIIQDSIIIVQTNFTC
ncbi:hypothetical protein RhiirA5_436857 [Rhizophagus irregularis]|uniref:FLYWCH-type domain-containing protein n=1 Tax=Rhizophagus irregularis TaxID=588596 RepID=A0A2N0NLD8_9GLOM|nr:hypothetical protein RhiirA5_436857 [Rhizophagus irregularis]